MRAGLFPGLVAACVVGRSALGAAELWGAGDSAKVRYGLRVIVEGTQAQDSMKGKLDQLQQEVKVFEQ